MTNLDENKEFLKISEAARLLGVSQKTVYRWILSGELAASKMGGLHLIRREDLQSRLALKPAEADLPAQLMPGPPVLVQKSQAGGPVIMAELVKCGACYQIIPAGAPSTRCEQAGCARLICARCAQKDLHYCLIHAPTADTIFRAAEEKLERGEYHLLVKSPDARQRELIFLNRLDARLSGVKSLLHPVSGELISIPSWQAVREPADEQTVLLKLLNRLFLDAASLSRYPLNASLRYRLSPARGQKAGPLEVFIAVNSRMERMVRQQYDTLALGREQLSALLASHTHDLEREQLFRILVLASSTGWDEGARQLVQGTRMGTAYFQKQALVYLYDFETGELIFDEHDQRASGYAGLFSPTQPDEELYEIQQAIESEMLLHDSLALVDALNILPYRRGMVEEAFRRLALGGRYRLVNLPQVGESLIRQG